MKEVVEAGRHVDIHYKLPLFTVAQVKSITSYQVQFQFSSNRKKGGKMDHISSKPELGFVGFIVGPISPNFGIIYYSVTKPCFIKVGSIK